MTAPSEELLRKLPKVDLHCHLDGALRVSTILDLGKKHRVKLPADDLDELKKFVQVPPHCRSLTDFLKCFTFFYDVLKTPEAMERISYELLEDAAKENVLYLETRFAPSLQESDSFSMDEVLRAVTRGLSDAEKKFGVGWGIILCIFRSHPVELAKRTVETAERFREKGVVAIDLAGDEASYPVGMYREAFELARKRKIPITCHAGEADGPQSVRNAVQLGAMRIGHGVRVREDDKLYLEMIARQIPFEICVTSNAQTRVVNDIHEHPLPQFFRDGLYVTLNTDDPGVSGIDLTHEYLMATKELGLSLANCLKILHNGVHALFLDEKGKKRVWQKVEEKLTEMNLLSKTTDSS